MTIKPLLPPFHWRSIRNIDDEEIPSLARYLGIELGRDFHIKSNWSVYRQYDVFGVGSTPIFHIKKSVEMDLFYEATALHLGRLADSDLCPENYIVGTYDVGFWRWKSPIPFILTTYVTGTPLKKGAQVLYPFQLGRQFMFHKLLELHDVYERHFILRNNLLVRIDFDLSFRELQGKYTGFDRWIKKYRLFDHSAFLKGVIFEVTKIKENLALRKDEFLKLLNIIKSRSIKEEGDKEIKEFYPTLIQYWLNNCADIFSDFDLLHL
ncbi:MAG: hypothetical protein ACTSQI_16165 [Candidatus Helarchaeota archaeon]